MVPAGGWTWLLLGQLHNPSHILGQWEEPQEQSQHWLLLPQPSLKPGASVLDTMPLPLIYPDGALFPLQLHRPLGWSGSSKPLLIVAASLAILIFQLFQRRGRWPYTDLLALLARGKLGGSWGILLLLLRSLLLLITTALHYALKGLGCYLHPLPIW